MHTCTLHSTGTRTASRIPECLRSSLSLLIILPHKHRNFKEYLYAFRLFLRVDYRTDNGILQQSHLNLLFILHSRRKSSGKSRNRVEGIMLFVSDTILVVFLRSPVDVILGLVIRQSVPLCPSTPFIESRLDQSSIAEL